MTRSSSSSSLPVPTVTIAAEPFRVPTQSRALTLSPDERWLATCDGATVRIIDAASGAHVRGAPVNLRGATAQDVLLAFNCDGSLLFVAARPGSSEDIAPVLVLDATDLTVLHELEPDFDTTAIAAHPSDAAMLLVAGHRLALFDARAGRIVAEFASDGSSGGARRAFFSRNGAWIVTQCESAVELWNVASRERTKRHVLSSWAAATAFSADGEKVFFCCSGQLVTLSTTSAASATQRTLPLDVYASSLAVSDLFELGDNTMLLCIGNDLRVFDERTLALVRSSRDRCFDGDRVLSADAKRLFSNSELGAVERMDVGSLSVQRPAMATGVRSLAWIDDDTIVAARDECVEKFDLRANARETVRAFEAAQQHAALSGNGLRAAVMHENDGTTVLFDTEANRVARSNATVHGASPVAVSDSGELLATQWSTTLRLVRNGVELGVLSKRIRGELRAVFVGEQALCWVETVGVAFADVNSVRVNRVVKLQGSAAIATNGADRVVVATKASLRVFDTNGEDVATVPTKGAGFRCAAIARDGALIAGGTGDGRLVLARIAEPNTPVALALRPSAITAMAFSRDGSRLAVATNEPELFVYDTASLLAAPSAKAGKRREK